MRLIVFAVVLGVGCGGELQEQHDQQIAHVTRVCADAVLDPAKTEVNKEVLAEAPKICESTTSQDECTKAIAEVFAARVAIRYPRANFPEVDTEQRAYLVGEVPLGTRLLWLEEHLRASQNQHLAAECEAMKNRVDANYAQAEAARRANVQRALQAAGQSLQNAPRAVNCTSNTVGASTFTNCH